jgi:hypothetical protein
MEMDAPLKRMVELRVHALRSEIAGLNTSSHAALSYAAHAAR